MNNQECRTISLIRTAKMILEDYQIKSPCSEFAAAILKLDTAINLINAAIKANKCIDGKQNNASLV